MNKDFHNLVTDAIVDVLWDMARSTPQDVVLAKMEDPFYEAVLHGTMFARYFKNDDDIPRHVTTFFFDEQERFPLVWRLLEHLEFLPWDAALKEIIRYQMDGSTGDVCVMCAMLSYLQETNTPEYAGIKATLEEQINGNRA